MASDARRSKVTNFATYSAYRRRATEKPSEQNAAATSAVPHAMRRLGSSLKTRKNIPMPSEKVTVSMLKRHSQ